MLIIPYLYIFNVAENVKGRVRWRKTEKLTGGETELGRERETETENLMKLTLKSPPSLR